MKPITVILLLVGMAFPNSFLLGQSRVKAVRVDQPPVINGVLDDDVWRQATPITEFIQREPNPGMPASEPTEAYVLYDDTHIYLGFVMYDDPAKVTAKEMARDISLANDDKIQIIIDTYGDRRTGYWFQISPRGSIGDAIVSDNGAFLNKEWNGLWVGKSRIVEHGWECEMAIPFKTLGFDKASTEWGFKLLRTIQRKLEVSYWPEANVNSMKFQVSDAGILEGLEGITQGIGIDISPYLLGGLDYRSPGKNSSKLDGGLDLFYQITPGLKTALTINTDFAETEVDDRQINLTRFNLHFPEKRAFFLDGANYFQFGLETDRESPVNKILIPFFSRRIGLDGNNQPVPIHYGGKLTGQMGDWNLGIMHISDERGDESKSFSVARVTRNFGQQSSLGVLGTYGNALQPNENLLAGADLKLASSTFRGNKNISLLLFALKSTTDGVEGRDASWGAQFNFPNDFLRFRLGYHAIGQNFNAGVGFVPRVGIRQTYGELMLGPRPGKWGIMQVLSGLTFDHAANEAGVTETSEIVFQPMKVRFISGEELTYLFSTQYEMLERDFNIYKGTIVSANNYRWWHQGVMLKSKGSRALWTEAAYRWGDFYNGTRKNLQISANWTAAVPLFLGAKLNRNIIDFGPNSHFVANIYQTSINFLFSPEITLNNYVQYDSGTETIGLQSRFQWIVKPGNEIILVYSARYLDEGAGWIMNDGAARLKLKYNIRF